MFTIYSSRRQFLLFTAALAFNALPATERIIDLTEAENDQVFLGTRDLWNEVWGRLHSRLLIVEAKSKSFVPDANINSNYYPPTKNFTAYSELCNTRYGSAATMAPSDFTVFEFDYILSNEESAMRFTASLDKGTRYADLSEYRLLDLSSQENVRNMILSVTDLFAAFIEQHTDLAVQLFLEPIKGD